VLEKFLGNGTTYIKVLVEFDNLLLLLFFARTLRASGTRTSTIFFDMLQIFTVLQVVAGRSLGSGGFRWVVWYELRVRQ